MSRLAFSTLGCPEADVDEVIRLARAHGVTTVELRCTEGQLIAPGTPPDKVARLATTLSGAGLSVACLASYVRLTGGPEQLELLVDVLGQAARLGTDGVRVFGGEYDGTPGERRRRAVRMLAAAAPHAEDLGVSILLETHDAFLTGDLVAQVLEGVDSPAVGAVWDVVNPWRAGEPLAATARRLAPWLRHAQLKDVATTTDLRPVLPGHGAVPLHDMLRALRQIDYTGPLSLEWERAWYPDADPLDHALTAFRSLFDGPGRP
ncbi:sugar phosphate isomerase/epimerase family protein [Streptomyces sp. YJ-C3]